MKILKTSKAQREASKRYMSKMERIQVTFPAGTKKDIEDHLEEFNCKSVAEFIRICTINTLFIHKRNKEKYGGNIDKTN